MFGLMALRRTARTPQVTTLGVTAGTLQAMQAGPSPGTSRDICTTQQACGADCNTQRARRADRTTQRASGADCITQRARGADRTTQRAHGADRTTQRACGADCTTQRVSGADWPRDWWPRSGTAWPWDWRPRSGTDWPRDWRPRSGKDRGRIKSKHKHKDVTGEHECTKMTEYQAKQTLLTNENKHKK